MAKIIVTGSLGLLGSHLVDYLHDHGHEVRGIDNLSTGHGSNTNPNAPTFKADLVKEPDLVAGIIEGFKPDVVYHLAAWPHEGLSAFCPRLITENNHNATMNVLIPSIRAKVKRFIFTSSMAVYGEQEPPFDEDLKRQPVDVYGISKTASEESIEALSKVHNFDYTIIRPHNIIGIRQNLSDPYRNVAGIFMRRALTGKNIIIYGDGEQKRAFSYIDDVTPHLANAAFLEETKGQIINVGPTEEFTVNELADAVIELAGGGIQKEYLPPRPLEVKNAWCTNEKAKRLLGYETKTPFKEGLKKMWDWAKNLHETTGIAEPRYLDELELVSDSVPLTWLHKTL